MITHKKIEEYRKDPIKIQWWVEPPHLFLKWLPQLSLPHHPNFLAMGQERFLRAEEDEAKLDGDFHHKAAHIMYMVQFMEHLWGFPKLGGTPKWMVYKGKFYYNGWFVGYPYFRRPLFIDWKMSTLTQAFTHRWQAGMYFCRYVIIDWKIYMCMSMCICVS